MKMSHFFPLSCSWMIMWCLTHCCACVYVQVRATHPREVKVRLILSSNAVVGHLGAATQLQLLRGKKRQRQSVVTDSAVMQQTAVAPASAIMSVGPARARPCPPSGQWCPGSSGSLSPPRRRPPPLTRRWKQQRVWMIPTFYLLHSTLPGSEMAWQKADVPGQQGIKKHRGFMVNEKQFL